MRQVHLNNIGYSSPAIGDLDHDGVKEIVVLQQLAFGAPPANVQVYGETGALYSGWPQSYSTMLIKYQSPVLANIDTDSDLEIVICFPDGDHNVKAYNLDGSLVWSTEPDGTDGVVYASPAVADIDMDSHPEIVVGTETGKIYAWNHDGTLVPGWPVQIDGGRIYSTVALADIDSSAQGLEVVAVCLKEFDAERDVIELCGFQRNGVPLSLSATTHPFTRNDRKLASSPTVADVDDDGFVDIVLGSLDNNVYAWDKDGELIYLFPATAVSPVFSSPKVGDLDNDGFLELVIGTEVDTVTVLPGESNHGRVFAWRLSGTPLPISFQWTCFRGDGYNTGKLGP